MKAIALFSAKGGVGKSSAAVNLAHVAATQGGRRTLLWDLDAQGAASFTLRLHARPKARARAAIAGEASLSELIQASDYANLDVLPADDSLRRLEGDLAAADKLKQLKKLLKTLSAGYDRVIIDAPPGLSELAERLFRAVDLIVSPLLPSPLSQRALEQLRARLGKLEDAPGLLPVWSMVDRRKALHRLTVAASPEVPVLPYAAAIEGMAVKQAPITASAPGSAGSLAFVGLWRAIEARLAA
ncbi:ParA family protein [Sandaracinobacteroides saxicola]|uniref:ParA family protein n=1 Tax=Sandaracinobacteroides saxicola TaxID=2759707 RepID=A0A7G5IK45_9SPHN|nr:ParA family protein [Sandaracinobacteroides saxicola]QMW23737.1 ParA family protein [Sandaracinobacteroides saxicola]